MMAEQNLPGEYENPYKFNAKELDTETELYYYGARYYNPRLSVWYGVDPLAVYNPIMETEFYGDGQHNGGVYFWGNLNPYIYTYQNPINFVDPNGKQSYFQSRLDSQGKRSMTFINSYESDNQKLNSTQVVAVFGKDNKFLKYEIGQTAVAAVQQEFGRHYNKPHLDTPSAGEAIGYVAEKAWESNEVRPVLLAPIEAAGIGTLVGFLKMATTVRLGTNLTKSQLKSISSLENQIYTHQAKLDEYIKNPMKFDNK